MLSNFKEKGIENANRAVEEDRKGNYAQAFNSYMMALEYLQTSLKYEKNEKIKETIKQRMIGYFERAEELKKQLSNSKSDVCNNSDNKSGSTSSVQQSKKKGDDSADEKEKLNNQLGGSILTEKPNVKWSDVAGLEAAKDALKEAVILPVKFPQFFTGKRKPWKGFLLYGPPGTGKSYLAKAVATEADSTFISVSSSDLVSKWLGESEKLVAQLFEMARQRAPSIIFIDEIDSLCSSRGEGESEAARRIKTEFLVQMQGVGHSSEKVLVLAATNLPYQIDQALRRRFDKRIYIPLPESPARATMFKLNLGDTPHNLTDGCFRQLAERTDGFSGSDIAVVVKDVLMEPLRRTQEATHFKQVQIKGEEKFIPCAPSDPSAYEVSLYQLAERGDADKVVIPEITIRDFDRALDHSRPTVSKEDLKVYENFTDEFGQEG